MSSLLQSPLLRHLNLGARESGVRLTPLLLAMALSGCALKEIVSPPEQPMVPPPLFSPTTAAVEAGQVVPEARVRQERRMQTSETPNVPVPEKLSNIKPAPANSAEQEVADITLAFDQLALPNFVQIVFGQILKKTFSMDPALVARTDLVTIRTPTPATKSQVLETTRMLLKNYGVAVQELGGFYRIGPDTNQTAYLPEIRRGRAQPDVPLPLRPVFSLIEMTSVRHSDVSRSLTAMFGSRITIQEDATRNALLISGQPADLTAALEAIQILDQPLLRGRSSQMLSPVSLGADDLVKRLTEILTAEGYAVGAPGGANAPITLLAIPASNALLVFAADQAVIQHVKDWAQKLDSLENDNRRTGNYFSYEVRYADAQAVARTMQELLTVQTSVAQESQQLAPGVRVIGAPQAKQSGGRIVVNPATNTLIFYTSNPEDQAQLLGILRSLDKPAKSAMIEVTVAEVRTGDKYDLGIEWGMGPRDLGTGTVSGGTIGGKVISNTDGLNLSFLNSAGVVRAKLNALASDSRARILSSPRVMARNGETASIQVGEEVPIITSQQQSTATTTTTTPTTGTAAPVVLQQIQYKTTGVLLKVKPIIYAGNRVEIEVQQEVSTAGATKTGVTSTPTFSTRKVDTKLSIRDGATVALGGLISSNETGGKGGVPFLKDIPLAGQLFRADNKQHDQTELIVLITPYVVDNDLVAEQVTQAMRTQLGAWAQTVPSSQPALSRPTAIDAVPAVPSAAPSAPNPASSSAAADARATLKPAASPNPESAVQASGAAPNSPDPKRIDAGGAVSTLKLVVPPGGKPVTDPTLLEELKRAQSNGGALQAPAAPATRPDSGNPSSAKPPPVEGARDRANGGAVTGRKKSKQQPSKLLQE